MMSVAVRGSLVALPKIAGIVGILAAALIGYGKLAARVDAIENQRIEERQIIIRELDQIHRQLDRIETQVGARLP